MKRFDFNPRWFGAMALGAGLLFAANVTFDATSAHAEDAPEESAPVSMDGLIDAAAIGSTAEASAEVDPASLEVVKVQPVAFQSTDTAAGIRAVFNASASLTPEEGQVARLASTMPALEAGEVVEEGFDFGGESTKLDIISLQYAYILGSIPMLAGEKAKFDETVKGLAPLAKVHGAFSAKTKAALDAYVASLEAGDPDPAKYIGVLSAATQGLGDSGSPAEERRHGYLLLGMWAGYVTMGVETGSFDKDMISVGGSLVMMLEKDATIGGSDRQLAAKLKEINAAIAAPELDKAKVSAAIAAMVKVSADK